LIDTPTGLAGEGTWAKLRRRKVVQWGFAYVAAAWGLLQGLGYLSELFRWPEQLQRLTTAAFLGGLPVALVLAWYHGDRGHQRVSGREFSILIVLLLIGGGLFWWVGQMPANPPAGTVTTQVAAPVAVETATGTSIAVLPFVNMSQEKDDEYFADGISEELLNVLVRVDGLGVASRTSSFVYKGSELGLTAIAAALNVNHILEGSVRKSGNRVRITAQLVDAVHDRYLWSETYDRELTDIFVIQGEIANAIVTALREELGTAKSMTPVTVRVDTENLEAYELYLKARELFIARRELPESIRLFEQVTQMDPNFARGWEGLAAVYSVAPSWVIMDRDFKTLTENAAERALKLDASLSMPWAALANAARLSMPIDWANNLMLLDRAIAADARNSTAFLWRGASWIQLGFFERAIADFDRCLELEPGYQNALRHKALALLYAGQTDAALDLFKRGVAAGFIISRAGSFVGPLAARGDVLAVQLLMDDMGLAPEVRNLLIDALTRQGATSKDDVVVIERYFASTDNPNLRTLGLSHPYLWLGDFDKAAAANKTDSAQSIISWELFPPTFRNSPGFKRVLEGNGVLAYWRQHGFPPQCRPLGREDFSCD
jgi:TolB-like protein/tetratricopeptide (TPR) repeat protein